jgi:hypothetical protein
LRNEPNFCFKNQLTGIFRLDEHDACDDSSRDRRPLRANLGWPAGVEFIDENGGEQACAFEGRRSRSDESRRPWRSTS